MNIALFIRCLFDGHHWVHRFAPFEPWEEDWMECARCGKQRSYDYDYGGGY